MLGGALQLDLGEMDSGKGSGWYTGTEHVIEYLACCSQAAVLGEECERCQERWC